MQRAFITGISRGIGRAICAHLCSLGYEVIGTYKSEEELQDFDYLFRQYPSINAIRADFSSREQITATLDKIGDIRFDALVHNAGMFAYEDFKNYDVSIWDRVFQVNLHSIVQLCTQLQFNLNEGGSIVIISSGGGLLGSFNSMSYCASKSALMNLTKSLANNFGKRNIRVNSIAPGWINTSMATPESYEAAEKSALGRNGEPEEIAQLVEFLISKQASFISGAIMSADGGYSSVDYILQKEAEARE